MALSDLKITVKDVREWVAQATSEDIQFLLEDGLEDIILNLEMDDVFGTEGFNKRFA